jgi:shikimate dehydrogenase
MPIGQNSPPTTLVTAVASTQAAAALAQAEVLIDATPLGMKPGDPAVIPVELLTSCHTVLDVVYGHGLTPLLAGAQLVGAQALDGLGMLVEQAALTIEIWAAARGLILTAPRALMREAALQELQSRS